MTDEICLVCNGTGEVETGIGMMVCDVCHGGHDDEPSCSSCGGPMYTQPHWKYMQCDDCGRRDDKEVDEP